MTKSSEDADRSEKCGPDISERADRRNCGWASRFKLVVVNTAHRFGDRCVRGPAVVRRGDGIAETGNREIDHAGVDRRNVVIPKTHARQRATFEVFGDDVELRSKVEDELLSLGCFEVDADGLLVEVVAQVGRTNEPTVGIGDARL